MVLRSERAPKRPAHQAISEITICVILELSRGFWSIGINQILSDFIGHNQKSSDNISNNQTSSETIKHSHCKD